MRYVRKLEHAIMGSLAFSEPLADQMLKFLKSCSVQSLKKLILVCREEVGIGENGQDNG